MNDIEHKRSYRIALQHCGWGELKLLLKLIQEKNAIEESIIKQLINEKRKNETT